MNRKKFSKNMNQRLAAWSKSTLAEALESVTKRRSATLVRWTPYQKVKSILLERTERLRLGLLNQDSSCADLPASTESELPNAQQCASF